MERVIGPHKLCADGFIDADRRKIENLRLALGHGAITLNFHNRGANQSRIGAGFLASTGPEASATNRRLADRRDRFDLTVAR